MARRSARPTPPAAQELAPRQAAILEAVVTEHVGTAQPVGSGAVAGLNSVHASPATVRSEMVTLEREGYLTQPHTSAGRIPTDQGYRYFVDHLKRGELGPAQRQEVTNFFSSIRGEIEGVLERTSTLLSSLTDYTSVVVGPSHASARVLTALIIDLAPRRAMVVAVMSDTNVERRSFDTTFDFTATDVYEASQSVKGLLVGTSLDSDVEVPSRNDTVSKLARVAIATLHENSTTNVGGHVVVGGAAKVASSFALKDTVAQVLGILEQEVVVASLLEDMIKRGVSVAIGAETGFEPLASCAVVVAPVTVDGIPAGAIGLLGPTRMNYGAAMSAAEVVSVHLAHRIAEEGVARG